MTHKRTKRDRSMSVEWVGGEWYWNCSLYDAARVKEAFRVYGEDPSRHDR